MLAQVLLIREAGVWLRGNELIIGAMLAAWLGWGAAGSLLGYTLARRGRGAQWHALIWLLATFVAAGELVLLRTFWPWTGGLTGATATLGRAVLLASLATALPSALHSCVSGMLLYLWEQVTRRSIALLYFAETLGAALAGAFVTFVVLPCELWWVTVAFIVSLPFCVTAWWAQKLAWRRGPVLVCAFALLVVWWHHDAFEAWTQRHAGRYLAGPLVTLIDAPQVHLAVTRQADEFAFYHYGRLIGSSQQREYVEELAGYAWLVAAAPRRALVLGFPFTGLVRELVTRGMSVTVLDATVPYLSRIIPFLRPEDAAVLHSPHVTLATTDPRAWLARQSAANAPPLDLVLQDVGVPESYATARFYSREWFACVHQHLAETGALVVVLPGSPGILPDDLARLITRVRATLHSVFSNVVLVPASATLLIATAHAPLADDVAWWRAQYEQHHLAGQWFTPTLLDDQLNPWRVRLFSNACARVGALAPQTDMRPYAYGDAIAYYETRFGSVTHRLLRAVYRAPQHTLLSLVCALAIWLSVTAFATRARRGSLAAWLRMTTVATASFVTQMCVIVRFVFRQGDVYYALGALFASFMVGLAAGTWWADRRAAHARPWQRTLPLLVLCATLVITIYAPWPAHVTSTIFYAMLLNAAGAAAHGAFVALAAWDAHRAQSPGVAVYAADLSGAVLGALLFSIIVPPALGFDILAGLMTAMLLGIAILTALGWFATRTSDEFAPAHAS